MLTFTFAVPLCDYCAAAGKGADGFGLFLVKTVRLG